LKETKYQENEKHNEIIVQRYFSRIKAGDIGGLLSLFSDDSIIQEPFSRSKVLLGKSKIESFLKSVVMANEGLDYEISIEKQESNYNDNLVAFVMFRKEHTINSKFTFGFENNKIKSLTIEFID
jgi:hypothetical protein